MANRCLFEKKMAIVIWHPDIFFEIKANINFDVKKCADFNGVIVFWLSAYLSLKIYFCNMTPRAEEFFHLKIFVFKNYACSPNIKKIDCALKPQFWPWNLRSNWVIFHPIDFGLLLMRSWSSKDQSNKIWRILICFRSVYIAP